MFPFDILLPRRRVEYATKESVEGLANLLRENLEAPLPANYVTGFLAGMFRSTTIGEVTGRRFWLTSATGFAQHLYVLEGEIREIDGRAHLVGEFRATPWAKITLSALLFAFVLLPWSVAILGVLSTWGSSELGSRLPALLAVALGFPALAAAMLLAMRRAEQSAIKDFLKGVTTGWIEHDA